jgi:endonuclease G
MKKYLVLLSISIAAAFYFFDPIAFAQNETREEVRAPQVSPNLVISQIYGGGGIAGSQFTHDFVEIFNRGNSPVNVANWSIQYASTSGSNWLPAAPLPNVTLQPGQYFLVQFASSGANGSALPAPDFIAPVVQPEGFIPNLSSTTGKLALVNVATRLPASNCPTDPTIVDFVGYGDTASCFEGAGRAPALTATTSDKRGGNGCTDTDNNNQDFTGGNVPAPRNTSSPTVTCSLGANLQAGMQANPTTVSPPATTLLMVSVIPATTPPSTGITVVGNLTSIAGSANQTFFDNGTNGDVTAGDNVFSFLATIAAGTSGGVYNVTAVASDAQARSVNVTTNITVNAPLPNEDPLLFGNPSNATGEIANENNYLMLKPQYSLSYNRSKATANWVAWRLDSSWIGTTPRQDDFREDPALPLGWYRVQDSDYSGSGFDRGHMCPSGDRTNSVANNSATFLMTNMVPQLGANNQGPWNDLENYLRTLAQAGNEVYIISGPNGQHPTIPTIAGGRIIVPNSTWKVVLVLPNGSNDLERVNRSTRVFGVIMSNVSITQGAPWRNFRVTVDAVEVLTGHNFFSNIPKNTQELIERKRDTL